MAELLTDDELELDDEQRKKLAPPIGKPLVTASQLPASMPAPDVGAASPDTPMTISGAAPLNVQKPPESPVERPQSKAFTDWQAQDLAKHPVGQPRYHGLTGALDTITGASPIGRAVEGAGELGTYGAEAKANRLAGNAAKENTQLEYPEKAAKTEADTRETQERGTLAGAQAGEAEAKEEATRANVGATTLTLPAELGGGILNVPKGREEQFQQEIIKQLGANKRNADTIDARGKNSREPIRVMGNRTFERTPEGNWKDVGPAPARAEQGNYSPVNDESGATVAWVNPKSGHMVKVDEIPGMGGGARDVAPGGSIPPKPNAALTNSLKGAESALAYAKTYLGSGKYTGPADEALMESFFELVKPSSGFRMSQPQIDMLLGARSWMNSAEGAAFHAANGVWFPPEQRKQIVDAMIMRAASKEQTLAGGNQRREGEVPSANAQGGTSSQTGASHFDVFMQGRK